MKAGDVVRVHCTNCGAYEYYSRAIQIVNIADVHVCRGSIDSKFEHPLVAA